MAKVYGIHEIELRPGTQPEEFERFMIEEFIPGSQPLGHKTTLLKGDRGVHAGKYGILVEFDSVEQRDQTFPAPARSVTEVQQELPAPIAALLAQWSNLATGLGDPTAYTDYVVVER